jgi:hypothetical protein
MAASSPNPPFPHSLSNTLASIFADNSIFLLNNRDSENLAEAALEGATILPSSATEGVD